MEKCQAKDPKLIVHFQGHAWKPHLKHQVDPEGQVRYIHTGEWWCEYCLKSTKEDVERLASETQQALLQGLIDARNL